MFRLILALANYSVPMKTNEMKIKINLGKNE